MTTGTKRISKHILPASSRGNERTLTQIQYGAQNTGKKAYIQAGLHADEAPGFVVMHHFINLLDRADAANKIEGQIFSFRWPIPLG
jgi:predicted deacylase